MTETRTGRKLTALELETLWPTVPADAKPGDDGLINELSVPQRLGLPAVFHRPIWDGLGRPSLWHCAVCWGDGWATSWPCEVARADGGSVVLDPMGLSAARKQGAAAEQERIGRAIDAARPSVPPSTDPHRERHLAARLAYNHSARIAREPGWDPTGPAD